MGSPRLIKKYPNRRLYDTQASAYITMVDVKQLVLSGEEFAVVDAKSGEDLTRSILLQIILEEESGGIPMFSTPVLMQIIRFYGNAMQGVMGSYLEKNIQAFMEIQERMTEQSKGVYGGQFGPEAWAQFMSLQAPVMQTCHEQLHRPKQESVRANAGPDAGSDSADVLGLSLCATGKDKKD
jgi:polyhydroxyalkanoate synthesis repressor PhaR